jgi:hypothetical protein
MATKNIEKKIDEIIEMMKILDNRLTNLEKFINKDEESIENSIIDIKPQKFNIDKKIVKDCLEGNCIKNDLSLIKEMYFKENIVPIKYNINKNIECRINGDWKCDEVYMYKTLIGNIKSCYLMINIFDNYENNWDQFMKNQDYIMKITSDNYLASFIKMFTQMLNKIK